MQFVPELFTVKHFNKENKNFSYFSKDYVLNAVPLYFPVLKEQSTPKVLKKPKNQKNLRTITNTVYYSDLRVMAPEFKMK